MAAPWHASMYRRARQGRPARALGPAEPGIAPWPGLLEGLLDLAPATLPLGLFGAWRATRLALTAEPDDRQAAAGRLLDALAGGGRRAARPLWPEGPRPALALFLMVPLNLLAARR